MDHDEDDFPASHSRLCPARNHRYGARRSPYPWSGQAARPGDIAIIDHIDIDRGAAAALIDAGVVAVINLAPSVSGRYPNLGPGLLIDAGVILIDHVDTDAFTQISDGEQVRVEGDSIYSGERLVASGVLQTADSVAEALEASKDGMASQLEAFSANAIEHLRREQGLAPRR